MPHRVNYLVRKRTHIKTNPSYISGQFVIISWRGHKVQGCH